MSRLNAEQITEVVLALVGDIDAHGETHLDDKSRENQRVLADVIDTLVYCVSQNTRYAKRFEHSMKVIGTDAQDFLGYLVEEYGLTDYVREDKDGE